MIDEIDRQIVDLLDDRAAVVSKVGHEKSASGDSVFVPTREAEVIRRAIAVSHGSLSGAAGQTRRAPITDALGGTTSPSELDRIRKRPPRPIQCVARDIIAMARSGA